MADQNQKRLQKKKTPSIVVTRCEDPEGGETSVNEAISQRKNPSRPRRAANFGVIRHEGQERRIKRQNAEVFVVEDDENARGGIIEMPK